MKQIEVLQMAAAYALSQFDHYMAMDKASRWTNEEYAAEAEKWFEKYKELQTMIEAEREAAHEAWMKEVETILARLAV